MNRQVLEFKRYLRPVDRDGEPVSVANLVSPIGSDLPRRQIAADMNATQLGGVDRVVHDHRSGRETAHHARRRLVVQLPQVPHRSGMGRSQGYALDRRNIAHARIGDDREIGRVADRVRMDHRLALVAEMVLVAEPLVQNAGDAHRLDRRLRRKTTAGDQYGAVPVLVADVAHHKLDGVDPGSQRDGHLEDIGKAVIAEVPQIPACVRWIVVPEIAGIGGAVDGLGRDRLSRAGNQGVIRPSTAALRLDQDGKPVGRQDVLVVFLGSEDIVEVQRARRCQAELELQRRRVGRGDPQGGIQIGVAAAGRRAAAAVVQVRTGRRRNVAGRKHDPRSDTDAAQAAREETRGIRAADQVRLTDRRHSAAQDRRPQTVAVVERAQIRDRPADDQRLDHDGQDVSRRSAEQVHQIAARRRPGAVRRLRLQPQERLNRAAVDRIADALCDQVVRIGDRKLDAHVAGLDDPVAVEFKGGDRRAVADAERVAVLQIMARGHDQGGLLNESGVRVERLFQDQRPPDAQRPPVGRRLADLQLVGPRRDARRTGIGHEISQVSRLGNHLAPLGKSDQHVVDMHAAGGTRAGRGEIVADADPVQTGELIQFDPSLPPRVVVIQADYSRHDLRGVARGHQLFGSIGTLDVHAEVIAAFGFQPVVEIEHRLVGRRVVLQAEGVRDQVASGRGAGDVVVFRSERIAVSEIERVSAAAQGGDRIVSLDGGVQRIGRSQGNRLPVDAAVRRGERKARHADHIRSRCGKRVRDERVEARRATVGAVPERCIVVRRQQRAGGIKQSQNQIDTRRIEEPVPAVVDVEIGLGGIDRRRVLDQERVVIDRGAVAAPQQRHVRNRLRGVVARERETVAADVGIVVQTPQLRLQALSRPDAVVQIVEPLVDHPDTDSTQPAAVERRSHPVADLSRLPVRYMPQIVGRNIGADKGRIQQDGHHRVDRRRAAVAANPVLGDADHRIDRLQPHAGMLYRIQRFGSASVGRDGNEIRALGQVHGADERIQRPH